MTLSANITIEGLDRLRAGLSNVGGLDAELRKAVDESAHVLQTEAKGRAVGNILPNSVQMATLDGGLSAIVGSVALTAYSIETGRKPGEMPEAEKIAAWASRKGLSGRTQSVKTHRLTRRTASEKDVALGLGWQIARQIQKTGTKPLPFVMPALPARRNQISEFFNTAIGKALKKMAHG